MSGSTFLSRPHDLDPHLTLSAALAWVCFRRPDIARDLDSRPLLEVAVLADERLGFIAEVDTPTPGYNAVVQALLEKRLIARGIPAGKDTPTDIPSEMWVGLLQQETGRLIPCFDFTSFPPADVLVNTDDVVSFRNVTVTRDQLLAIWPSGSKEKLVNTYRFGLTAIKTPVPTITENDPAMPRRPSTARKLPEAQKALYAMFPDGEPRGLSDKEILSRLTATGHKIALRTLQRALRNLKNSGWSLQ